MKHPITDEQIHQIFKHADSGDESEIPKLLKEWFPDAFMQKGVWYYEKDKQVVVCFSGEYDKNNSFGFFETDTSMEWCQKITVSKGKVWRKLPPYQVMILLIGHARKLGFLQIPGVVLFDDEKNTLRYEGSLLNVFDNGKWADLTNEIRVNRAEHVRAVNKWYKEPSGRIRFFRTNTDSVGFDVNKWWTESHGYTLNNSDYKWSEASPLDVQFALMAYAYKEYKPTDRVKSITFFGYTAKVRDISFEKGDIWSSYDTDGIILYNDRFKKWAEKC